MDAVGTLLFEMSSPDRLKILLLLKKAPLKLSHISEKLDFTVQETARNISRLTEAKLLVKDVNGLLHLTPYGEEILELLSGFRFLLKNNDYFLKHSAKSLPKRFELSLGVLEGADLSSDVMLVFHNVEKMITEAQESICILTNQILASSLPFLIQAMSRGVTFRLIMPKEYTPTKEITKLVNAPAFEQAARAGKMDFRFMEKVGVFLCFSERQVAALGFSDSEGKLDYASFATQDLAALDWAKDLYNYYWNSASDRIPDQLFTS